MSYMENKDYGEIFCQAVDEIVGQRLEAVKFDQTILCTIVDDSWRDTGKYTVTNNGGTTKFEAFSENTDYRNNNNVYVQIPNGDWDQQKIIIGKKTDKTDEPYIYKKPFSSLVDITGNLITGNIERKATGLIANDGITKTEDGKVSADQDLTEHVINLWTYNINDNEPEPLCKEEGVTQSGYTRLGIQAGFQSWLNTFYTSIGNDSLDSVSRAVTQGKYGLRLIVTPKRESVVSVKDNSDNTAKYILELNTDDMNGNPYDFASFYTQQKLFDISSIGEIEKMQLQFYETTGSFVDSEGYYISDTDFLGNSITPNLYVNDVYISLGYDVDEFDTEMVQIYTLDPTTYSRTADPATNNHKKLQLRWIHKMDDGTYKSIISSDDIGNYEVRWYRYQLGAASADEYSGVYWKYLSIQRPDANVIKDPDWEFYNINNKDVEFFRYPGYFYSWAIPDTTLQQEQYKAIILYDGKPYRSNVITFQNKDEVVSAPTVDAVQALSINCEDGTYGNYRIYNNGNSLLDFSQSSVKRQWKAYFKSALEEVDEENNPDCELIEAEQIEWIIPLTKTMIVLDDLPDSDTFDEDNNPFYSYDYDTKGTKIRIHIFKYGDPNNGYSIKDSNTLTYRIKGYYSQTYSDNTIQCKIIKDKITYTATKEMTFGIAGTTGTDCTFILDFDNGITAVTNESNSAVTITARLYDYENNEVDISGKTIEWSWKVDQSLFNIVNADGLKSYQIEIQRNGNAVSKKKENYAILQAKMTDWGDFPLVAYLPIPLKSKSSYDYISGTTQVIYNSNGELIDYFKNPYVLYDNAVAVDGVTWNIFNGVDGENAYTPKKTTNKAGEQYLTPLSFYVDNACQKVCIVGTTPDGGYWSQPILIMINRYPSAMVNQWDGKLKVDEKKGWILSPRLVAGKKESNNTFSGVMLGDFSETDSDASLTSTDTGLYGYDCGEQTYAFKQDGTAFIGKSGAGRIEFDGNEGIIESGAYKAGKTGMSINLAAGTIDAHTFTLTAGKDNATIAAGTDNTILIDTEATNYPLRIGSQFSVAWDGTLSATNGSFSGSISGSTITGSEIYVPNEKAPSFSVNSSGHLDATGATISGAITATTLDCANGTIGGWTIGASTLTGGSVTLDSTGSITIGTGFSASGSGGTIGGWNFYTGSEAPAGYTGNGRPWTSLYSSNIFLDATRDYPLAIAIPSNYMFNDHGYAAFKVASDGSLSIGGKEAPFKVTSKGEMTATSGTIGGWTISSEGLSASGVKISPSGGITGGITIDSAKITKGTLTSATISSCNITSGMQLNGSAVSATSITYVTSIDSIDLGTFTQTFIGDVKANSTAAGDNGYFVYGVYKKTKSANFMNRVTIGYTTNTITTLSTSATSSSSSKAGDFASSVGSTSGWIDVTN